MHDPQNDPDNYVSHEERHESYVEGCPLCWAEARSGAMTELYARLPGATLWQGVGTEDDEFLVFFGEQRLCSVRYAGGNQPWVFPAGTVERLQVEVDQRTALFNEEAEKEEAARDREDRDAQHAAMREKFRHQRAYETLENWKEEVRSCG